MNWKSITAFGIMGFITLTSVVYAYVQQTVANEQRRLAEHQMVLIEQSKLEAEKQREQVEEHKAQAERTMELYMKTLAELEELKKKKK